MTTSILFCDDGGRIVCLDDASSYLRSEVKNNPTAGMYYTPLGSWLPVDEEWQHEAELDGQPMPVCEECGRAWR